MLAAADQQQVAIGHKKVDYKTIPKWHIDSLLREYGLHATDGLNNKRKFAIGPWALGMAPADVGAGLMKTRP